MNETSNAIITTHALDFLCRPWGHGWMDAQIGTVGVLWKTDRKSYIILSIINHSRGNGHLTDVFEWFEFSCKRDKKSLKVIELWNKDFMNHLIIKKGFVRLTQDTVEKKF